MSQLVLDDQLDLKELLPLLGKWVTFQRLGQLRRGEHILDERVAEILLTLRQPTFVTIDRFFWDRQLCHPGYAMLFFDVEDDHQDLIPGLLRPPFRLPAFGTRAVRMGKVARVRPSGIDFWQFQVSALQHLNWPKRSRKRRK